MTLLAMTLLVLGSGVFMWFWAGFLYKHVIVLRPALKNDPVKIKRIRLVATLLCMAALAAGLLIGVGTESRLD